jgi:enamine deaminase RidA (YjgF/YER057c/UK114 family)
MNNAAQRLADLGIELPEAVAPVANYVPVVLSGSYLYLSGQISIGPTGLIKGKLGADLTIDQGVVAARACAINLIVHTRAALGGDLDRVRRIVKLNGYVNCTPDFQDQPIVVNGASDLFVAVFGDAGRHARAAVGAPSLPLGAAVEVDAVIEVR